MPYEPQPDGSDVAAVLAGHTEAFRALVARHAPRVFAVVRAFVRDAGRAEDLAQDTFTTAFEHLEQFDPARGAFGAWLLTIARNKCRDALRRRREPAGLAVEPQSVVPVHSEHVALDAALDTLTAEQRIAFVLVDQFELPLAEAAHIAGVPLGTIKSRASRARTALRDALTGQEARHERT